MLSKPVANNTLSLPPPLSPPSFHFQTVEERKQHKQVIKKVVAN